MNGGNTDVQIGIKLVFTDNTEQYDFNPPTTGWETMSIAVSSGNDGKTLHHIGLQVQPSGNDRNPVTWRFDHAVWTRAA